MTDEEIKKHSEKEICHKICIYKNRMNCEYIKDHCDLYEKMKKGIIIGVEKGRESALKELLERVEKDQAERQVQTINVIELKAIIKEMGVDL